MFFKKKHIKGLSDEEMIELYKDRKNNTYIGILYERYYHMVFGVCLKYLKSAEESEDAVSLIFEKVILELDRVVILNFSGWIYMISKNFCLQKLRKKRFSIVDFKALEEEIIVDDDLIEDKEKAELVLDSLSSNIELLKEEQKVCIKLFYLNKKSYSEIESLTNYPMNKVKSYIQNGKRKLMILMENDYKKVMD